MSDPTPGDPTTRMYLHARCHPESRLVAWVAADDTLVLACATCETPVFNLGAWERSWGAEPGEPGV